MEVTVSQEHPVVTSVKGKIDSYWAYTRREIKGEMTPDEKKGETLQNIIRKTESQSKLGSLNAGERSRAVKEVLSIGDDEEEKAAAVIGGLHEAAKYLPHASAPAIVQIFDERENAHDLIKGSETDKKILDNLLDNVGSTTEAQKDLPEKFYNEHRENLLPAGSLKSLDALCAEYEGGLDQRVGLVRGRVMEGILHKEYYKFMQDVGKRDVEGADLKKLSKKLDGDFRKVPEGKIAFATQDVDGYVQFVDTVLVKHQGLTPAEKDGVNLSLATRIIMSHEKVTETREQFAQAMRDRLLKIGIDTDKNALVAEQSQATDQYGKYKKQQTEVVLNRYKSVMNLKR